MVFCCAYGCKSRNDRKEPGIIETQAAMFIPIATVLVFTLIFKESHQQSCSSTVAITSCPWNSLKSAKPLRIDDYKPYLSISKGNLDVIPNGAFKFIPQITTLELSHNKIKTLDEGSLEGLGNLKTLNLYDNQLTAVNQNALKHCRDLVKLDFGLNKINFIHDKAFDDLEKLRYLNLAFNSLKAVPVALNVLLNLNVLRLDNNAIDALRSNAFSRLDKLEELSLNDNKLTTIERDGFKGLVKLKKLDLRSNFLTDINVADLIEDARNIVSVSLSINDFKCDSLRKILDGFRKHNVEVSRGVSRSPNNINGISCKI